MSEKQHDLSNQSSETQTPAYIGGYPREVLDEIKLYLTEYLESKGAYLYPSGANLAGLCPIHDDTRASFSIFGEYHDRWRCFACDSGGDVFDLSIELGFSKNFHEAVREVAGVVSVELPVLKRSSKAKGGTRDRVSRRTKLSFPEPELGEEEEAYIKIARIDLRDAHRNTPQIVEKLAAELGIPPGLLMRAARGTSGLGLVEGKLAYVYPKGVKIRNAPGSEPRFIWAVGRAYAPWRFERVGAHTTTIYLTEGESDALAIIAAGMEADGKSVVVASPGTSFPASWAPLFTRKHVVICFDFDAPGQRAAEKVAEILNGYATAIMIVKTKV